MKCFKEFFKLLNLKVQNLVGNIAFMFSYLGKH